jgi:hypothetical protein
MGALGYKVRRREPIEGPMLTPVLHQQEDYSNGGGNLSGFDERIPQSQIACRPSRRQIAFFLAPIEWPMGCGDFIMGHETIPFMQRFPRGRLSTMDDRRNVSIPPRVSYGSQIPELDGLSPNGLD